MSQYSELFRGKASVYALDEQTKQWVDRGTGGQLTMFLNNQYRQDVRVKWTKNNRQLWWRLMNGKLKPKGPRAWVLKAWETSNNQQEILAIRFSDSESSNIFSTKYHQLFPQPPPNQQPQQGQQQQQQPQQPQQQQQQVQQPQNYYPPQQPYYAQQPQYGVPMQMPPRVPMNINVNAGRVVTKLDGMKMPQSAPVRPNWAVNISQSERSILPQKMAIWECAVCTYSNDRNKPSCQMCGLSADASRKARATGSHKKGTSLEDKRIKPMIPQSPAIHNGHSGQNNINLIKNGANWNCVSCTFANNFNSLQCGVCGAKKPIFRFPDDQQQQQQHPQQQGKNPYLAQSPAMNMNLNNKQQRPQMNMPFNNKQKSLGPNTVMSPHGNVYHAIPPRNNMKGAQAQQGQGQGQGGGGGGKTWICPICTLHNSVSIARCDACHTARGSASAALGLGSSNGPSNYPMNNQANNPLLMNNNNKQQRPMNMGYNNKMNNPLLMGNNMQQQQHPRMSPNMMGGMGGMNMPNMMNNMNPHNMNMNNMNMNNHRMNMNAMQNMMKQTQQMQQISVSQQMNGMSKNGGKLLSGVQEFQRAASDIACYNDNPSSVFSTLRSVAKKLLKDDVRYRTLDTTNPKVMERLIGFEGVLDFLMLLGFESDAMGMKLVCEQKPSQQIVRNAIEVLNGYEARLGIGRKHEKIKKDDDLESHITLGGPDDNKMKNSKEEEQEDTLTLEQIILWSTHESMRDNDTMETLIITHKTITDSLQLMKQLRRRFFVPIPNDIRDDVERVKEFRVNVQKRIQLKVIKSLRDWMKKFWTEDFENDELVQLELKLWLKDISKSSDITKECKWIGPLGDTVNKEFERFKLKGNPNKKTLIIIPTYDNIIIPKKYSTSSLSPEDLSDQLTFMDYRVFSRIQARECLGQAWKKKNNQEIAPNILGMIQQFNNLTVFVQIQILRERSLKERGKAMKRVIKMGEKFRELRNYNSLCAVFSALNSAPIHRLKLAWKRVPEKHIEMFNQFKMIFARDFNHRNLRQLFRNSPAPSIPHIGLFLQDLVFIDDGNSTKIEIANFKQHGSMVNFNKCVRVADRIKNIILYQSHPYNIDEKPIVQKILLKEFENLKEVTEDQIWDMSSEIKKQDERDAKKAIF